MLKHAGDVFLQTITILLNRCLTSQLIPKQWKEDYIFPISKKPVFDGNLHNTRPISLIEYIKKLYTKILTNRLIISLMSKQILSLLIMLLFLEIVLLLQSIFLTLSLKILTVT